MSANQRMFYRAAVHEPILHVVGNAQVAEMPREPTRGLSSPRELDAMKVVLVPRQRERGVLTAKLQCRRSISVRGEAKHILTKAAG